LLPQQQNQVQSSFLSPARQETTLLTRKQATFPQESSLLPRAAPKKEKHSKAVLFFFEWFYLL